MFWSDLMSRAELLDLTRPLFFALRFSKAPLRTPISEDVIRKSGRNLAPNPIARTFMDACSRSACLQPTTQIGRVHQSPLGSSTFAPTGCGCPPGSSFPTLRARRGFGTGTPQSTDYGASSPAQPEGCVSDRIRLGFG